MDRLTNREVIEAWSAADPTAFGEEGDVARRFLLNPTIFALLGEIDGKHILDAGSGQGYLARMLARRGASVTAIEPAESFVRYAMEREHRERLGITYLQGDLSQLDPSPTGFDAVVANMVFMDIPDYQAAMRNCVSALRPGGQFVFSLTHPCFEESSASWNERGLVEVREYLQEHVRSQAFGALFHRPLSQYLNLVIDLECTLTRISEPKLSPELVAEAGTDRDVHVPSFIVIQATKLQVSKWT